MFVLAICTVSVIASCSRSTQDDNSSSDQSGSTSQTSASSEPAEDTDPTGTYVYENGQGKTELVVSSSTWYATTTMKTGFGDDYDASQAMTSRGIVNDGGLYDETGYIKVGKLWKNANKKWAADLDAGSGTMVLFKE